MTCTDNTKLQKIVKDEKGAMRVQENEEELLIWKSLSNMKFSVKIFLYIDIAGAVT